MISRQDNKLGQKGVEKLIDISGGMKGPQHYFWAAMALQKHHPGEICSNCIQISMSWHNDATTPQ